ncbi:MAG: transcriptional repressor LexA [Planctomycetes bacterium]|nr:transcriptional repressor LexA [Planctomycetota bacterium]
MSRPLLTRRQHEVLICFAQLQDDNGLAPTLEELGRELSLNRATVHGHVQALVEKGMLENLLPGASRGLDLTEAGKNSLPVTRPALIPDSPGRPTTGASTRQPREDNHLRLLGRIAAGGPIETLEEPVELDLPDYLRVQDHHYLLEVAGDSMQNAGIHPGDLVMIDSDASAKRNDIVVAVLDKEGREECTLKRWHPLDSQRVLLLPENPNYTPLEVATRELKVRGVVRAVIRRI